MSRRTLALLSSLVVVVSLSLPCEAGKGGKSSTSRSSSRSGSSHTSSSHTSSSHSSSSHSSTSHSTPAKSTSHAASNYSSSSSKASAPASHSSPASAPAAPSHTSSSNTHPPAANKYSSSSVKSAPHADPSHNTNHSTGIPSAGPTQKNVVNASPNSSGATSSKYSSSTNSNADHGITRSTSGTKPVSTGMSSKARANQQAASQRTFLETQKATAPSKPSYVDTNGKTVNVRTDSKVNESIRNRPSTYYSPDQRSVRYGTVINNYHYQHPYSYYSSQPFFHVGGGFSSAFWWMMMMEWSAQRRASWLYHNESHIERDAYERGMKDAEVAKEVARLKAANTKVDPDYVDEDFKENPDLMYTQDHVEAVYSPTYSPAPAPEQIVQVKTSSGMGLWLGVLLLAPLGMVGLFFVIFRMKVTS